MAKRKTRIIFTLSPKSKKRLIAELLRVKDEISKKGDNDDVLEKINQILEHGGGTINFDTKDLGNEEIEFVTQLLGDLFYYFFKVS